MFEFTKKLRKQSQTQQMEPRYTLPSGFGYQPKAVEGRGEPNPPPRYP